MRNLWMAVLSGVALAACESTPPVQPPDPVRPAEPERQVFRPMDPIADDFDEPVQPTRPTQPTQPAQPVDSPLPSTEAAVCEPIATIRDRGEGDTTFYKGADGTVSFAANMNVNTDGTLKSYSASDPGYIDSSGKLFTRHALNSVCNGLRIMRNGKMRLGPKQCRELLSVFEKFRDAGWPAKSEDGDYIDFYAMETRDDSGPGKKTPCLADDEWMISTTKLPTDGAYPACDQQAYLDARQVNAIVMPTQVLNASGADPEGGDFAVVRYRGKVFGAIVGDSNPRRAGEGTLALVQALRALDPQPPPPPSNIRSVYAYSIERPPVEYFVFPGTRAKAGKIVNARGPEIAKRALEEAERRGVLSVRACGFKNAGARSLGPVRRLTPEEGLNDDPDVLKDEN